MEAQCWSAHLQEVSNLAHQLVWKVCNHARVCQVENICNHFDAGNICVNNASVFSCVGVAIGIQTHTRHYWRLIVMIQGIQWCLVWQLHRSGEPYRARNSNTCAKTNTGTRDHPDATFWISPWPLQEDPRSTPHWKQCFCVQTPVETLVALFLSMFVVHFTKACLLFWTLFLCSKYRTWNKDLHPNYTWSRECSGCESHKATCISYADMFVYWFETSGKKQMTTEVFRKVSV